VSERESASLTFARRTLTAASIVASLALFLAFLWFAADLLLLVFAAVLFSILLRGSSRLARRYIPMSRGAALLAVSLALLAMTFGLVWLVAGQVGAQLGEMQQELPQAVEQLKKRIEIYAWGRDALQKVPSPSEWFGRGGDGILSRFTGIASSTLGVLFNGIVVVVIGLYLAAQPELYSRGLKRLVPKRYRPRAGEIVHAIDDALWRWLIGRFGLMLLNATVTAVGLWLLGVKFFFTLGLLTGLLNFIPNIGPVVAAIPAILLGLMESPWKALYVAILYLVLQGVDAYVLTPLVDRRSVKLPPVLTIMAQVLLGAATGFLGLLLASPLATAVMILVQMIYVEDVLGDSAGSSS
jgi:predicted PurR-regulated permease PerM